MAGQTPKASGTTEDQLWGAALKEVSSEMQQEITSKAPAPAVEGEAPITGDNTMMSPEDIMLAPQQTGETSIVGDATMSALGGIAKSFFETKDFFVGEPEFKDKAGFRNAIETSQAQRELQPGARGVVNGAARNIAQFLTGFVGVGKFMPFLKTGQGALRWGKEAGRAAAVGAIAFDPHEERLSNLVEQYPSLNNPITAYLASDPKDARWEGRTKAAIESVVGDALVSSIFVLGLKAVKYRRAGNTLEDVKAEKEATELLASKRAQELFDDPDTQITFDERAAIMEVSGGLSRADAQAQAAIELGAFPGDVLPKANAAATELDLAPGVAPRDASLDASFPDIGGKVVGNADGTVTPSQKSSGPFRPGGADGGTPPGATPGPGADGGTPGVTQVAQTPGVTADPNIARSVHQEPAAMPDMAQLRKDQTAINQHGGIEKAMDEGYRFKGDTSLPYQRLTSTEEVQAFMGAAVDANKDIVQARRGGKSVDADGRAVMSDKEQDRLIAARVRLLGEDPAVLRQILDNAGDQAPHMAANMETSLLIAEKGFQDTYLLHRQIQMGNFGEYGTKEIAQAALKQRLQTSVEMAANATAMLASAGRTLRRARGEFKQRAANLAKLEVGNLDPDALALAIENTGGDTAKLAKLGQPSYLNMLVDYAGGLQAANLLWGWKTHAVNMTMNVAMLAWRPLENVLGGSALGVRAALTGDEALGAQARTIRTQARREAIGVVSQLADGWGAAKMAFMAGDSKLTPHTIEVMSDPNTGARLGAGGQIVWKPIESMEDVIHNALMAANTSLHGSLRLMGAADEMIRTIRYRSVVQAKAMTDADALGLKAGSQPYRDYVDKRLTDAFDAEGRAVDANAAAEAKSTVFGQDLLKAGTDDTWGGYKSMGAKYQEVVSAAPYLRLVTPFVKTPTNLMRYGVKLTPGLNMLQKEYNNAFRGLKGPEAQAKAVGQMMLGSLIMSQAAIMAYNGRITGSGPQDPKAKREWLAEGNRPYSIVYDAGGGKKGYLELNRMDPIQMPFAIAADMVGIMSQEKVGEDQESSLAMAAMLAVAHQFRDKTYLKNLNGFLEASIDDRALQNLPRRMAPGMIPFSTLFRSLNDDQYVREVWSTLDAVKATLPGYSDELEARYDFMGRPVKVAGAFHAEQTIEGPLGRAIDASYAHTGNMPIAMNPREENTNKDLREIVLESGRTAYGRLQELSNKPFPNQPSMEEALTKMVTTPEYRAAGHGGVGVAGTKEWLFAKVVSDYRRAAMQVLQREDKTFRESLGKASRDAFQAAVSGKKDIKNEAAKASAKDLSPLLAPFGLTVPGQ